MTLLVNLLAMTIAYIPRVFVPTIVWVIKQGYLVFGRKEVAQLYRNADQVLGLPSHSQFARTFVEQNLHVQITIVLETLREVYRGNQVTIEGYEGFCDTLKKLRQPGNGLVVVTAHVGSWELLAKCMSQACDGDLYVLAKPARYQFLTKGLESFRQQVGVKVLWTDDRSLLRRMIKALRAGSCLGFVMDQKPQNRVGQTVSFLGHDATFVAGPGSMAQRTGAAVAAIFCVRVGEGRYQLKIETVSDGFEAASEEELTRRMVKQIENVVRMYPEQWTWTYKRWTFSDGVSKL